jgi:HK97 family phage portal protein
VTLFGYEIARKPVEKSVGLSSVNSWGGSLWGYISESFSGAWQRNVVVDRTPATLLAFSAVYACVTGIAYDIAKNRLRLMRNVDGIWKEIESAHGNDKKTLAILRILRKPNDYQNLIQFIIQWILSKLLYGNAYILKQREPDGTIVALYVLHPPCVTPLVATDGSVFYSLNEDYLAEISEGKTVPASEIIHDRMATLWHPLVGVSPLYACAMSVTMGNKIQSNSAAFFSNQSKPGGVLTAPGEIADETAARLKAAWETNYGGENTGRIAVLGDGLKFEPMRETAQQSETAEQLKWTVGDVARAFHYPEFKLGGPMPPYQGGVNALITTYYTDCLQFLIESLELTLDEGLGLPEDIGIELDLENLMRMDTAALFETNNKAVGGGWMKPNEARLRANQAPVEGGDTPYLQQQNYSLAALAKRDAGPDPFGTTKPPAPPQPAPEPKPSEGRAFDIDDLATIEDELRKELVLA